ncbi:hypothetical protein K431DRAFT_285431 [Polychaeton citri CBS 116435]|uniref:Uncharacterized protein n=1 Tax=Polychaeton citri CBS 116435 TaxID=1314669 RepID=A0A9P4UNJ0_9PEZI|nr:hypothetical protein K431DRAFT_285431 [Polychaeton citri CBS 116435]
MFWFLLLMFVTTSGIIGTGIWDEKTNHNLARSLHDIDEALVGDGYKHSILYTRVNNGVLSMEGLLGQDMGVTAYNESGGLMHLTSEKGNDKVVLGGIYVKDNVTVQPQGLFKARISGLKQEVTGNWFLVPRVKEHSKRDVSAAEALTSELVTIQNADDLIANLTKSISNKLEQTEAVSSVPDYLGHVVEALLSKKVVMTHGPDAIAQAIRSVMDTTEAVSEGTVTAAAMHQSLIADQESREAANKVIEMVFERKFPACERRVGPCEKDLFADLEL